MTGAVSALYDPLLERELDAIAPAVRTFRESHSLEELWLAVTRFALLAYSPSEHSRHALLCCLAARGASDAWMIECARYAAESRQPWSEPPILDPPPVDDSPAEPLRSTLVDRARGEIWLAKRIEDAERELLEVAREHGDSLLIARAAIDLVPLLGERGRYATLRVAVWDLIAKRNEPPLPARSREDLSAEVVESNGAIDAVNALLVALPMQPGRTPEPYPLARDYGHLLLAHAAQFPEEALRAVAHNLEHGESYAEWTLA